MASNYSVAVVKIKPVGTNSWIDIPTPTKYKMTSSTLVDSARNTKGYVVGSVIRNGIRKIEMTWNFLTQAQFSLIAKLFEPSEIGGTGGFYCYVQFYDTILGAYVNSETDYLPTDSAGNPIPRTFYGGDRISENAEIKLDQYNKIVGYANVHLSLIEC